MKTLALILLFTVACSIGFAQSHKVEDFKIKLKTAKNDTNKLKIINELSLFYIWSFPDTAIFYAQQSLALAQDLKFEKGIASAQSLMGSSLTTLGNYPLALDYFFKSIATSEKINNNWGKFNVFSELITTYRDLGDTKNCLIYARKILNPANPILTQPRRKAIAFANAAAAYEKNDLLDSTIILAKQAYKLFKGGGLLYTLGNAYLKKKQLDSSLLYYNEGVKIAKQRHTEVDLLDIYIGISNIYRAKSQLDSAIWYAKKAIKEPSGKYYPIGILNATSALAELYEMQRKPDSTLKYLKASIVLKDSLFNREKTMAIQNLAFKEQEKQKEIEASELKSRNELEIYVLVGGLLALLVIAGILFRNNRHTQKANNLLSRQKEEINLQRDKAEKALSQLKATQAQLIQSEKLASLGELTAGIAHEIQNPLNFVNNFSELSVDLAKELKEEIEKPEIDKELIIDLANDLSQNQEKINHHGKRASSIVKGMLEHSRASSGERELTDINHLADEAFRLSYHGLRAKDKNFNAKMVTDFDENLPKINVIQQDISRVLLNLMNNAFYAVNSPLLPDGGTKKTPIVTVSTKYVAPQSGAGGAIIISVKDNGTGIPDDVKAKIFQPFFTTKPTGQGTGLGLSLAYDIITKGHGGTIEVETKEGEFTEFIIKLPI